MSKTQYLNTDLDLSSNKPFNELNEYLNSNSIHSLNYSNDEDNEFFSIYEINEDYSTPELTIKCFLYELSKMNEVCKARWNDCLIREFNIGYDCGIEPCAFENSISHETLKKMIGFDLSLKITIYPEETK